MFTLKFKTDNAAFEDDNLPFETVRILQKVIDQVNHGKEYGTIHDVNGNSVGEWSY